MPSLTALASTEMVPLSPTARAALSRMLRKS